MFIRLLIITITMALLMSCEENAIFEVPGGDSKLFAFSEITEDDKIAVSVHTSIGVNTDDSFTYPKQSDAQITLYENGVPLENPGFRYISSKGAFISQGSFRPSQGIEYSLEVCLKDKASTIKPIFASTIIPIKEEFTDVTFADIKTELDYVSSSVNVSLEGMESDYLIIKPQIQSKLTGEYHNLEVNDIFVGREGSQRLKSSEGLIVCISKLRNSKLGFNISGVFNQEIIENLDEIAFEVNYITKDAFHYYSSFDKAINSSTQVMSEPVISFTNFEGGLGLFTGFSKQVYFFQI